MIDFSPFWCCLGENEQAMLNFMGTWLALPDPVVYKATYDAVWEGLFDAVGSPWYDTWADIWGITFTEVEIIPGFLAPAAVWMIDGYLSFGLWQLDPGYACPDPCRYTTGAFSLPP
jgi:hypothetical protein